MHILKKVYKSIKIGWILLTGKQSVIKQVSFKTAGNQAADLNIAKALGNHP